jgi:hypothetical protein
MIYFIICRAIKANYAEVNNDWQVMRYQYQMSTFYYGF